MMSENHRKNGYESGQIILSCPHAQCDLPDDIYEEHWCDWVAEDALNGVLKHLGDPNARHIIGRDKRQQHDLNRHRSRKQPFRELLRRSINRGDTHLDIHSYPHTDESDDWFKYDLVLFEHGDGRLAKTVQEHLDKAGYSVKMIPGDTMNDICTEATDAGAYSCLVEFSSLLKEEDRMDGACKAVADAANDFHRTRRNPRVKKKAKSTDKTNSWFWVPPKIRELVGNAEDREEMEDSYSKTYGGIDIDGKGNNLWFEMTQPGIDNEEHDYRVSHLPKGIRKAQWIALIGPGHVNWLAEVKRPGIFYNGVQLKEWKPLSEADGREKITDVRMAKPEQNPRVKKKASSERVKTFEDYLAGERDLAFANLRYADLDGANLNGAQLRGADLYGAACLYANLQNANLEKADLRSAGLHSANFRYANLSGANLSGANLRDAAQLRGADLQGANLQDANLQNANLLEAFLFKADLRGADLKGANLDGANLNGAQLRGADLQGANLQDANLFEADLRRADLSGAKFERAYLFGADLSGANLRQAYFYSTDLESTELSGADLSGANFSKANLTGADLSDASWNSDTIWPSGFTPPKKNPRVKKKASGQKLDWWKTINWTESNWSSEKKKGFVANPYPCDDDNPNYCGRIRIVRFEEAQSEEPHYSLEIFGPNGAWAVVERGRYKNIERGPQKTEHYDILGRSDRVKRKAHQNAKLKLWYDKTVGGNKGFFGINLESMFDDIMKSVAVVNPIHAGEMLNDNAELAPLGEVLSARMPEVEIEGGMLFPNYGHYLDYINIADDMAWDIFAPGFASELTPGIYKVKEVYGVLKLKNGNHKVCVMLDHPDFDINLVLSQIMKFKNWYEEKNDMLMVFDAWTN